MITFNDAGEGVSITKLSPKAVKANTVNTKCAANDQFTGMWGCFTLCTHAGTMLLLLLHAHIAAIKSMLCPCAQQLHSSSQFPCCCCRRAEAVVRDVGSSRICDRHRCGLDWVCVLVSCFLLFNMGGTISCCTM